MKILLSRICNYNFIVFFMPVHAVAGYLFVLLAGEMDKIWGIMASTV